MEFQLFDKDESSNNTGGRDMLKSLLLQKPVSIIQRPSVSGKKLGSNGSKRTWSANLGAGA